MATEARQLASGRWNIQIYLGRDLTSGKIRFESKTFDRNKEAEEWALQERRGQADRREAHPRRVPHRHVVAGPTEAGALDQQSRGDARKVGAPPASREAVPRRHVLEEAEG